MWNEKPAGEVIGDPMPPSPLGYRLWRGVLELFAAIAVLTACWMALLAYFRS